jgi:hypothetical protein
MNFREKLCYIALGGALMLVGMLSTHLISPNVTAQQDVLGEIKVTKLTVVNKDGNPVVDLGTHEDGNGYVLVTGAVIATNKANDGASMLIGGAVVIQNHNNTPVASMGTNEHGGGYVTIYDDNGKSAASMGMTEDGGQVRVTDKMGGVVLLETDEHGGAVAIYDHNQNPAILLSNTEHGSGVSIYDHNQNPAILLSNTEHGGGLTIFNKGQQDILQAGVGDMGGGIITTRDKNGYRTGSLP